MSIKNAIGECEVDGATGDKEKSYKLYTKEMEPNVSYNVIRFCSPRFDVHNLIAPINLTRDVPKPVAESDSREKKKASTNVVEGGQQKELLDYSKLAPYGNAIKNRQNLFRKMTRTYQMSHNEASEVESRYKDKSLSKYPWKFSDFESPYHYTGTPEGNLDSTHVLLKATKGPDNEDAFLAIPVKRWYKFIPKPWYRKPGDQKTEEIAAYQRANLQTTSFTHSKEQGESSHGGETEMKSWKTKFLNVQQETANRKRERTFDGEDEELDYEEEFADDEEINLGIEDAEDQKEALGRQFGKYSKALPNRDEFGDNDEEFYSDRIRKSTGDKNLSNNLRRTLDYKVDESGDETFIFGDNEDLASFKNQGSKPESFQSKVDKKFKPDDSQQQLAQRNKKVKKDTTQQAPLKKEFSQQLLKKKSLSNTSLDTATTKLDANKAKKVPQPDTSTPIRNVSITSNNVQSNNNLSNAVPLNNNTLSQPPNFKKTILSSSPPNNSTQPEGVQSALNKQQSSTDIDTVGSSRPKKKFVTEDDVINIYAKKGSFAIKAKELVSELVLMCENNLKSKEHLKSLLNKMVKSEGGILHLTPEYRRK